MLAFFAVLVQIAVSTTDAAASLDLDPIAILKFLYTAIHAGQWPEVGALFVIAVVATIRKYGKVLHEKIPDDSIFDAPFFFFLESQFGGWVLSLLTAISGGFFSALALGKPLTGELAKSILGVFLTSAAIYEGFKNFAKFLAERKAAKAAKAEAEAKAKAAVIAPSAVPPAV